MERMVSWIKNILATTARKRIDDIFFAITTVMSLLFTVGTLDLGLLRLAFNLLLRTVLGNMTDF